MPKARVQRVTLHDGSIVKLRKVDQDYDATNRDAAYAAIRDHQRQRRGDDRPAVHLAGFEGRARPERNGRHAAYNLPHEQLCPGNDALQKLMGQFR